LHERIFQMVKYPRAVICGILLIFIVFILLLHEALCQQKLVKVLVASPYIKEKIFDPVADVMAGCIIRELRRVGGMEIIDREVAEKYIQEQGGEGWIATREQAVNVGKALGANIVIYSTIQKNYDIFVYRIALMEVDREIIQRISKGEFRISESASEVGRIMKKDMDELKKYIPLPSELADPGMGIRDNTIDPDNLPKDHEIEDFPFSNRYGVIEQVFNYYRVFPGELEFQKFESGTTAMRLGFRDDMDEELTGRFNLYRTYGDFAIRHNLQAFFIRDCSTKAVNVLLANNIPIFYANDVILEYHNLTPSGFCWFQTLSSRAFDTTVMSHRDRMVVMIILPKPGRKGGISREYIESAIGRYKDEWGKTPTLVEIKEGLLDIESGVID